ncbi:MAG: alcohol dehydrogenase catalytic domain-containing protein [Deltaproteobacteria bacterium]|nr:alcohol dehydrogenase catalytic domain-containing protein [Deltaproteobacteria bacterium]
MWAVVKERQDVDFCFKETPIPEPRSDEVLIRVEAVGICGSDIPIFKGIRKVVYPLIPGHEFAGVIVKTGRDVKKFRVGDKVVPGLVVHCGECEYCRMGLESLCDNIYELGIHVDGAFAEYVVAPEKTLHALPVGLSFNQGAAIDPIASAFRPVRKARITSDDDVVIFGPGPIGLYALQIARAEGARRVAVVGANGDKRRLELAGELGADITIDGSEQDTVAVVRDFTHGRMADVVIEATGAAAVIEPCLACVRKAGRLSLAGIFHQPSSFSIGDIVRREITITGSICYTWLDFQACVDLVASGRVRVEPLITHEFSLREIGQALAIAYRRESIKIMLHPNPENRD